MFGPFHTFRAEQLKMVFSDETFWDAAGSLGQILPRNLLYPEENVEEFHQILVGTALSVSRNV